MDNIQPLSQLQGHKAPVITAEYAKNTILGNHVLASGSEDKTCRLWDLQSNKVIKGLSGFHEPVTSIKFATKSSMPYMYLSSGTKVYTFDLRNQGMLLTEPIHTYEFSQDEINQIDVHENNQFLATADDEGSIQIIDLNTHKIHKKTSKKHSNICMTVKFRPKKPWEVWSGGMDSKVYNWDFSRGLPTHIYDMSQKEASAKQMFNPPFVHTMAISPDGTWIAAGLGDTSIQLISPPSKKQKTQIEKRLEDGHNTMVNCLSFLTHEQLLSGSTNGRVTLWNITSLDKQVFQLDHSMGKLNSLQAWMHDRIEFAAAGTSIHHAGALNIYTIKA
ncbi:WD repeat-containing protein 53 [Rhizopus stolonifer]|uniref:WD repeat-containing protein 53 n=1 Tax=Rhizopus stolonifer TaxID=4846 RepID=A0A367KT95_RHIST|nr:WD repeat-containing protein 53 [Rhizopus stolonifer]